MKARRGTAGWIATALVLVFALTGVRGFAQEHGHEYQGGRDHTRFDDHDRQAVRGWYDQHRRHLPDGLRDKDRLPPQLEARLRAGAVLDPELRRRIHPVPHDLEVLLAPPPRHYRYVLIGGHICLIDDNYHLFDVIHLEMNF